MMKKTLMRGKTCGSSLLKRQIKRQRQPEHNTYDQVKKKTSKGPNPQPWGVPQVWRTCNQSWERGERDQMSYMYVWICGWVWSLKCFIWIVICSLEAKRSSRCKQSPRLSQMGQAVITTSHLHLVYLSNTHRTNEKVLLVFYILLDPYFKFLLFCDVTWVTCIALAGFHSLLSPCWIS